MESESAEQPAPPVVWEREYRSARGGAIRFRAVRRLPGVYACESSTRKDATGNHVWDHAVSGASGIVQALLADYCALSAFVAENPGLLAGQLLHRTPPTYKTLNELHSALLADPQISFQNTGATEKKRGWYAVFGKPEAAEKAPVTGSRSNADIVYQMVHDHPGKTVDELHLRLTSPELVTLAELEGALAAHPRLHLGVQRQWWLKTEYQLRSEKPEAEPEPAAEYPSDDELVDLVRKYPGRTSDELWRRTKNAYPDVVDALKAHPGISRQEHVYGAATYRLAEPTP